MAFDPVETAIVVAIVGGLTSVWWWQLQKGIDTRFAAIKDEFRKFEERLAHHERTQAVVIEEIRREMSTEAVTHERVEGKLQTLAELTKQQHSNLVVLLARVEEAIKTAALVVSTLRRDVDLIGHRQDTAERVESLDKKITALDGVVSGRALRTGTRSKAEPK